MTPVKLLKHAGTNFQKLRQLYEVEVHMTCINIQSKEIQSSKGSVPKQLSLANQQSNALHLVNNNGHYQ